MRSALFRASAEGKFDSCLSFTFYIDDQINVLDKKIVIKFESEGYILPQHTSGENIHNRHLTCNDRSTIGEISLHNSITKVYNRQFNIPGRIEGFS